MIQDTRTESAATGTSGQGRSRRSVGFPGLTFVSLGSIIGSGWLLGADKAAISAGPASLLSWILAAAMLAVLALIHAELGAAYPVAGGTARFPAFAFGKLSGFVAGWTAWLQAVTLAPIEVEASLTYLDNIGWVNTHLHLLNQANSTLTGSGFLCASVLMILFVIINIVGVKFMSESNSVTVVWKTIVPVMAIVVLLLLSFHGSNFHTGGGFAPYGAHGVFAALPAGVVFALQGFEQCIQFGGEARNPQRDISRAVLTAVCVGTAIYILLEIAFVGSLNPAALVHGWNGPIQKGSFGPYATLATAAGAGWLAYILYVDAFISPAGTGLIYLGTSSRLSYAQSHAGELPKVLSRVSLRGVPVWSIALAFVIGELSFLPFPSWQSLVNLVTSATAMMYAFAPISLAALRNRDPGRRRPYRLKGAALLAPIGFCSANLIIYWAGFDTTWRIELGIVLGLIVFALTWLFSSNRKPITSEDWKGFTWLPVWLIGLAVIGYLGRYDAGKGGEINFLPNWWDLVVVIVFSLVVFYGAVSTAMGKDKIDQLVSADEAALAETPALAEA